MNELIVCPPQLKYRFSSITASHLNALTQLIQRCVVVISTVRLFTVAIK